MEKPKGIEFELKKEPFKGKADAAGDLVFSTFEMMKDDKPKTEAYADALGKKDPDADLKGALEYGNLTADEWVPEHVGGPRYGELKKEEEEGKASEEDKKGDFFAEGEELKKSQPAGKKDDEKAAKKRKQLKKILPYAGSSPEPWRGIVPQGPGIAPISGSFDMRARLERIRRLHRVLRRTDVPLHPRRRRRR